MYIVCLASLFVLAAIFLNGKINNGRLFFVLGAGIVVYLFAALRGYNPLVDDVLSYIKRFETYSYYTFSEMMEIFGYDDIKSPFFHLTGWFFSRVLPYSQAWIAFIALLYVGAVVIVIKSESEHPVLSFVMFFALSFFGFSLSGLRQTMAMAFTTLAYFPLKKRKPIKFVLLVFLATLFHTSAIIFLLIYPIARRKLGWLQVGIFAFAVVLFIGFEGTVRATIATMFEDSYLSGYATKEIGLSISGFIIQAVIFAFSVFYYKDAVKRYRNINALYNLSFAGLLFQLFSMMIAEMFRVSMYFSVFNIVLLTKAVNCERDFKIRIAEKIILPIIFLIYFFRSGIPAYRFFWQ